MLYLEKYYGAHRNVLVCYPLRLFLFNLVDDG